MCCEDVDDGETYDTLSRSIGEIDQK